MDTNLTALESELLTTLKGNNNPDDYNCDEYSCWFSLESTCGASGLDIKEMRGVLSSLIKKGIITDLDEKAPDGTKYYEYMWN